MIDRLLSSVLQANSSEVYDPFGAGGASANQSHAMKYSDMIRFFEVYPQVTYIFDSTMTEELHEAFLAKLKTVVEDKKMPVEDLCRAFNILVRLSAYSSFEEQRTY